jgi:hypothetical protein
VDPLAENIQNAFVFTNSSTSRRGGRNRDVDSPEADFGERKLHTNVANAGSIWQRAEDFWQIVGWAFNCSVAWKNRWERWRLWLEVILDFVEADWQKRVSIASDSEDFTSSLIWRYIDSNDPSSRTTRRRIIRAILADGSPKSMREFTEVFKDETKERKKDEDAAAQKRKVLDIDNDEFGDYDLSEDEDAVPEEGPDRTSTRPQRKVSGQKESPSTSEETSEGDAEDEEQARNPVDQLGGMDAVKLRQRLLFLVRTELSLAMTELTRIIARGRSQSYRAFKRARQLLSTCPILDRGRLVRSLHRILSTTARLTIQHLARHFITSTGSPSKVKYNPSDPTSPTESILRILSLPQPSPSGGALSSMGGKCPQLW